MSSSVNIRIGSSGARAVDKDLGGIESRLGRIGQVGKRTGAIISGVLTKDIGAASGAAGRLYGIFGGIGAGAAGKQIMSFSRNLAQLKADAEMSETEIQALKQRIEEMASKTGIMTSEISGAYRVFMDMGGQMGLARDIMSDLALFSKATGTEMGDAANIAATLSGNLGMSKDQIVEALSTMNELGKAGQMSLKDVAANMPQILAAGKGGLFTGPRAVAQLGAAHQIISKSYGTGAEASNMARTSLDALMRDLTAVAPKLKGKKVDVYEKVGGVKRMRDLDKIMEDIGKLTKGDPEKLAKIFTADSRKAAAAFYDTGGKGKLSGDVAKLFSVRGTRENLEKAYAAVTTGVGAAAHQFDQAAAKMESALQQHGAKLLGFVAQDPKKALALAGGGYLGIKVLAPLLAGAIGKALTGGKGGKGIGGLLGAAGAKGLPVYVTNFPGAGSIIAGSSGSREVDLGGGAGSKLARGLNGAAAIAGTLAAAYAAGTAIDQLTGASDALSDSFVALERAQAKYRVAQFAKSDKEKRLLEQAEVFTKMSKGGVQSIQVSGGGRVALTKENALAVLMTIGSQMQMSKEEIEQLVPALKELTSTIRLRPPTVKVQPSRGLDSVDVQGPRGRQ